MERPTKISLRLSEEELALIRENADKVNLNVSDFLRQKAVQGVDQILYDPEVREAVFEALELLRTLGNMVYDLSKGTNEESSLKDLSLRLSEVVQNLLQILKGANHGNY